MIPVALVGAALGGGPSTELTFGAKTRPVGMAALGSLWWDAGETVDLGAGLGVYFYWYELDLQARAVVAGGFIVATGQVAAEPGWFRSQDEPDGPRRFMFRPLGRGRLEVNLRNDLVWLYIRNTGLTRVRPWAEYDPFRDKDFPAGPELSIEHSTALMLSPSGTSERKLWFYVEITLEASARGVGWLDRLPRAGVIGEKITPTLSFDLDLYYSLMPTKIGGPGVLGVLWWNPGAGRKGSSDAGTG